MRPCPSQAVIGHLGDQGNVGLRGGQVGSPDKGEVLSAISGTCFGCRS